MLSDNLFNRLKQVARDEGKLYYEEAAAICGLDIRYKRDRQVILPNILREINENEVKNKRPMITVLVVSKTSVPEMPSKAFFELAVELKQKSPEMSDKEFFEKEAGRVYLYWSNK